MNIVDLRNSVAPVSHVSHYDRLSNDSIEFLKSIIPEYIFHNSTELVKSIHNLVWRKGIPIYLVNKAQMPDEFNIEEDNLKDDNEPPTEFLGYYKYINFGKSNCESVFLCMDRIKDDKRLLAKVLVHELGHALMEADVVDFGYNFKENNFIKFMEESLANYIVLKYFSEINNNEMLVYSKGFIKKQSFGYNFGIKWFDNNLQGYDFWIKIKKEFLTCAKNRSLDGIINGLDKIENKYDYKINIVNILEKIEEKEYNELIELKELTEYNKFKENLDYWIDRLKNAEKNIDIINL